MRAVRCHQLIGPEGLRVDELPQPSVGSGQVLVDVRAASVNFPDLLLTQGKYQFKPDPPFSPGCEVAGVVREVGSGVVGVSPGDRVVATMIHGAFAEQVVVSEAAIAKLPDAIDFETGAAITTTYATTMHALVDRARLREGETLLVLGAAGGVGSAAVEIGKCLGAKVIAAASSAAKLEHCRSLGADFAIDYTTEDLKARAKALSSDGVDVVYDPVGGDLAEAALRSLRWDGRLLIVGFASGSIPKIPANLVLLKSCQIVGVFWGAFAMRDPAANRAHLDRVFGWIAEGKLRPHVDRVLPFSEARAALELLARREVMGKLVLAGW